jgi:hypothetical protein
VKRSRNLAGIICAVYVLSPLTAGYATETNETAFTRTLALDPPEPELSLRPVKRYEQELLRNQGVVIDRFGPPSYLDWTRRYNHERYIIHDHINSSGKTAMTHLVGDSVRETAVAILPLEEWKAFGRFVLGSIGNTAEERTETISASFSETGQFWREEVEQDKVMRYGVRPWRSDPYGYFGLRVGHWGGLENLPLFVFEGRVGYKLFNSSKLEGSLTLPLPHRFQLVGGIATNPLQLGSHNHGPTVMSGRLEYVFTKSKHTKVMYVGAQSSAYETLLATGVSFDW